MIRHSFQCALWGTSDIALGGVAAWAVVLGAGLNLWAGEPSSTDKRSAKQSRPAQSVEGHDFRARTDQALSAPFPTSSAARKTQATELVSLYKQIGAAAEVATGERNRLQARIKSRLSRLADAIALDLKRAKPAGQAPAGQARSGNPTSPTANRSSTGAEAPSEATASAGSKGGAPQNDGQALVELIQATIAPQSWDVNGGQSSIVYWPAWHVLVVRQTDDVHDQIGGAMHAMRK